MVGAKGNMTARQMRTLARALVVAGERKRPGDRVRLRPDQIARLEPEGYFAAPKQPRKQS